MYFIESTNKDEIIMETFNHLLDKTTFIFRKRLPSTFFYEYKYDKPAK